MLADIAIQSSGYAFVFGDSIEVVPATEGYFVNGMFIQKNEIAQYSIRHYMTEVVRESISYLEKKYPGALATIDLDRFNIGNHNCVVGQTGIDENDLDDKLGFFPPRRYFYKFANIDKECLVFDILNEIWLEELKKMRIPDGSVATS